MVALVLRPTDGHQTDGPQRLVLLHIVLDPRIVVEGRVFWLRKRLEMRRRRSHMQLPRGPRGSQQHVLEQVRIRPQGGVPL